MRYLIDILYLAALLILSPKIIYRALTQNRYKAGLAQRLGNIKRLTPEKPCVWIHAVSVGEVNATKTLIASLEKSLPEHEIVISATTDTGFARATALYGSDHCVFFFPFDFSAVMTRTFKNLRPDICLLMELEVWPNLTTIADKMNIPVVVVNGRISDRSFPRYKLVKPLVSQTFRKVSLALAQTDEYAKRFVELGCAAKNVIVTNSLKYDTAQIADKVPGQDSLAKQLSLTDQRLFVAGGTGPGEEKMILEVFQSLKDDKKIADLHLAIVPRKPERFDEVAKLIESSGFSFARYSTIKNQQTQTLNALPDVVLGDTMGDLKKIYALSTIVFVGRTLVPMGGSDMMESTAMGKCTIFGPHTFNFKQTVDVLRNGKGAIEVNDQNELLNTMRKCLTETEYANTIANNGRNVIQQNQGATQTSVNAIVQLLINS